MSEQLTAAAEAMNVPQPLVERSARAWAAAADSSYEDVLSAWAGGGAAPSATSAAAETDTAAAVDGTGEESAVTAEPEASAPAEPVAPEPVQPAAVPAAAAVVVAPPVPEEVVDPVPLGERIRLASRLGAWIGAGLGLIGFVLAATWLLSLAAVAGEEGAFAPAVEVTTSRLILGVSLISVIFGIVVATSTRAAIGWLDAGARLEGRSTLTVVLGAVLGLVLGVAAGAVMVSAFSEPIEGTEGVALMRIVPSLIVVLIGGAVMGALTATLVQLVGVPAAIDEHDAESIHVVRRRLSAAVTIPVAAATLLTLLVLPLGLTFIRSNELASGGAAVLAILAAAGILGFATLSASRPEIRISFGEFLVAVIGIATVVVIVFAVFSSRAPQEEAAEGDTATEETTSESTPEETTGEETTGEETTGEETTGEETTGEETAP